MFSNSNVDKLKVRKKYRNITMYNHVNLCKVLKILKIYLSLKLTIIMAFTNIRFCIPISKWRGEGLTRVNQPVYFNSPKRSLGEKELRTTYLLLIQILTILHFDKVTISHNHNLTLVYEPILKTFTENYTHDIDLTR